MMSLCVKFSGLVVAIVCASIIPESPAFQSSFESTIKFRSSVAVMLVYSRSLDRKAATYPQG